jgi:outer membrane protein assembly factor BamD (BamD/ComL family)
MMRTTRFAVALITAALSVASVSAVAADKNENKITTKALADPVKKIQAALTNKQFDVALTEIKKAQAVEKKTPFEEFTINEFLAYVDMQQKKWGEAAQIYEHSLDSPFLAPDQQEKRPAITAQLYFEAKDYKKVVELGKRYLDKHPGDEDMLQRVAMAYFELNDLKNAGDTMKTLVAQQEKAGRTPKENSLQVIYHCAYKLNDDPAIADSLRKLVRYYPNSEYWDALLDIYKYQERNDHITLGFYRLMEDVGVLKRADDYMEMAQLAMDAGVPGEAQHIVETGMQKGVLKSDDKTTQGRYDRLLNSAKSQATADKAGLPQLAKEAQASPKGQSLVGLGQAYLSYGQTDEAIQAIKAGIDKGNVTDADEAQISLGLAYLKKGQKDQARQAFKTIKDGSKWNNLADLWVLRTYS